MGVTRNSSAPFTHKDTVVNILSYKLPEEELDIMKFGLTFLVQSALLRWLGG